jgi:hypothetical protein
MLPTTAGVIINATKLAPRRKSATPNSISPEFDRARVAVNGELNLEEA